jgi:TRAP-type C4-dicarboxylate transport system permease small subunit
VFSQMLKGIHWVEDSLLVAALASMLGMAVLQILLRNFFDFGIFWAESFLRILVLWVAMLGAMVATRESNHISIDVLTRYVTGVPLRIVSFVGKAFSALVCGVVAYYAFLYVQFEFIDETIEFAQVPTWVCQSIIPVGFSVMALRFGLQAILSLVRGAPS